MPWQGLPDTDSWKPITKPDGTKIWQHETSKKIIYFNPEKLENAENFIVCIDTNAVIVRAKYVKSYYKHHLPIYNP